MIIIDFENIVNDLTKAFGLTDYVNDIVKESNNKMPDLPMTKYGKDGLLEGILSNGHMIFFAAIVLILLGLIFYIGSKYKSGRLVIAILGLVSFLLTVGVSVGTAKVATDVVSKIESVDRLITKNMK